MWLNFFALHDFVKQLHLLGLLNLHIFDLGHHVVLERLLVYLQALDLVVDVLKYLLLVLVILHCEGCDQVNDFLLFLAWESSHVLVVHDELKLRHLHVGLSELVVGLEGVAHEGDQQLDEQDLDKDSQHEEYEEDVGRHVLIVVKLCLSVSNGWRENMVKRPNESRIGRNLVWVCTIISNSVIHLVPANAEVREDERNFEDKENE